MIRKAKIKDIKSIYQLINTYAEKGSMLPRSQSELYHSVRDFFVAEKDGTVIGCCALHIIWEDLAEIRSLAVQEEYQKQGMGSKLVNACLEEAKYMGVKKVFVLTEIPNFFKKIGFKEIDKTLLPHKIWSDCIKCVKFPNCSEVALMKELEI